MQCILFRPALWHQVHSNFQWSTTSRDAQGRAKDHITREPEQVRAFRDTWKDGIHSYLTYLREPADPWLRVPAERQRGAALFRSDQENGFTSFRA